MPVAAGAPVEAAPVEVAPVEEGAARVPGLTAMKVIIQWLIGATEEEGRMMVVHCSWPGTDAPMPPLCTGVFTLR